MEFRTWFEEQFGTRPKALPIEQIVSLETKYRHEKYQYDMRLAWELKFDACLKAWQVKHV